MPEQNKKVISSFQGDKNPDEKILALGKKITDVIPHKIKGITSEDAEYWGLKELVTDEMADVALTMKVRVHYPFEDILEMNPTYKDHPEDLRNLLDKMAYIGLLEFDYGNHYTDEGPIKDAPKIRRYMLPTFVPGSAEFFNMRRENLKDHPAMGSFFERMTFVPLAKVTSMIPEGGDGVGMHVIPVEKAISMESKSLPIEHLSYWLKKYDGHLSKGICSCRASRTALGEGCADDDYGWCIGVGDMADYCVDTNKGEYITKEEALEIFKKAEANGFVHQITNIDGKDKIIGICNCDVKICNALRTSLLFNTPNMSRSAYTAKVDPTKCVACGLCVENCPAGAAKLGQKLCKKDGSKVEYPKAPLPDNLPWGKYAWDEEYRDTARMTDTYETGTAPCKVACPAHVPVQGYLKMAHEGKYTEALELIKTQNPFPAVCGRVCNKRCEQECTRGEFDKAVAIDAVKKFIAEQDLNSENRFIPEKIVPSLKGSFDEKIAIIGAGPAGLTAAYYLALLGYKPTVFEKNPTPGGMMVYGIPSYKLEKDVINKEIEIITKLGVEIKCNVEVGKDVTISSLKEEGYKAFYIAIGCQGGKRPNVSNDTADGTYIAVDYLKDAYLNQSQEFEGDVVVIGGGNVAVDCARTAHRFHSNKVTMVSLEDRDSMPASKEEIIETLDEDIQIVNSYGPKEVLVDENGHVKGIVLKKCTSVIDPETKKFNPQYDENDTITLDCTKIVFAIGQSIEWGNLLEGTKVTFWHGNYPIADKMTYQTADEDIFVGGDVYTGPKFVIDAIAAGHAVADALHRHVHENASPTIAFNRRHFVPLNKMDISVPDYDHAGRVEEKMDESIDHKMSFKDAHLTLTEEEVKKETARCLSCGASIVDPHKCIGCGICTTKCKFDAIHLVRDHPKASTMVRAEDKVGPLLKYAIKRRVKIILHSTSKEAKLMRQKRKEFNKLYEKNKATMPDTGNSATYHA
jgi:NADPH-dependent glutamate synthase beta subunit-like oxidoreductase/Fe-S-cluster-containing dehydrogenase component